MFLILLLSVDTDERSPIAKSKYQEGFKQCLGEANRYLQAVDGLSNDTRMKMTNHLCSRLHENTSTSQLNQRDGNPLSIARLPNDLSLLQNNQVYTNTSKNGHTQSQLFLLPNDANPSTSQFGQLIVVPNDTILSRKDNSSPAMLFLPNQGIGCSSPCVKRESVWRPWWSIKKHSGKNTMYLAQKPNSIIFVKEENNM